MNIRTLIVSSVLLLSGFSHDAFGQNADEVIEEMVERFEATPRQVADISITTSNIRGDNTEKKFNMYLSSRDGGKITLVREPHKEGLFLSIKGGEFREALYWNSTLSSVARINLSDQDMLFAATAFSYEDVKQLILSREDSERFAYSIMKEDQQKWQLRAVPRSASKSQYEYRTLTIRKSDFAVLSVKGFVADELVRHLQFSNYSTNGSGTPQPQAISADFFRRGKKFVSSKVALRYSGDFPERNVFTKEFITGVQQ